MKKFNILLRFLVLSLLSGCASPPSHPKQYQVTYINCSSAMDAERALGRIHAGESFEQVAREVSTDRATGQNGGHLDWAEADMWSANFAAEVKRLPVGKISEKPIHTEYGWQILRVDAVR